MKIGDTRQAGILSVVAVVAVGFVIMQMFRSRPAPLPAPTPAASEDPSTNPAPDSALPASLAVDTFSHPALAKERETAPPQPEWNGPPLEGLAPFTPPGLSELGPPSLETAGKASREAQTPRPQEPEKEPEPAPQSEVRLSAVVKADSPIALITVDALPSREYRVGDKLLGNWTVARIDDDGVHLRAADQTRHLGMGETLKL